MFKKTTANYMVFILAAILLISCSRGKKAEKPDLQIEPSIIEVSIGGMTCTGCEQTIQAGITRLEGIKSVKASYVVGNALVEYYPGITDTVKIKAAITGSGYTVNRFNPVPSNHAVE
jgi:copper chaperone CopZ